MFPFSRRLPPSRLGDPPGPVWGLLDPVPGAPAGPVTVGPPGALLEGGSAEGLELGTPEFGSGEAAGSNVEVGATGDTGFRADESPGRRAMDWSAAPGSADVRQSIDEFSPANPEASVSGAEQTASARPAEGRRSGRAAAEVARPSVADPAAGAVAGGAVPPVREPSGGRVRPGRARGKLASGKKLGTSEGFLGGRRRGGRAGTL